MPVLGTWVTLVQGESKGSKARRANAQTTPALVSAVCDGTVTVLYPNNLVLRCGFKGAPLKRVVGVSVDKLRRFAGSDVSLQLVEKALLTAVKAEAGARAPATPLRRAPATPQTRSLVGESSDLGNDRARSRSRSPMRKGASSPKTPTIRGQNVDSRCLTRQDTEEKVCLSPPRPASQKIQEEKICLSPTPHIAAIAAPAAAVEMELPTDKEEEPKECISQSPKSVSRRRAALTLLVGRELRAASDGRMARDDLEQSLFKGSFDAEEIAAGLQRLDDNNKIMLMDSLVFLV